MNFSFKLNPFNTITKRLGINPDGDVTLFFRNECDRFMDPYIPMQSGILKDAKTYPSNHEIKYTSLYAHYMYKGVKYISPTLGVSGIQLSNGKWWSPKDETKVKTSKKLTYSGAPKRGSEWDKRMKADKINTIVKDVENYLKRK